MEIFRWIRWNLPYNRLDQMIYQDENGNEWPLNDAWTYARLRAPLQLGTLILYLPSPLQPPVRQVYTGRLNVYDILSILDKFYNRPITPEERQSALEGDFVEFLPELRNPLYIIKLSDLMPDATWFEGFAEYEDGWTPILGPI
jgi:hypothetical protein